MGRDEGGNDACPTAMLCGPDEMPAHPANISSFALDTFEVTVGRFRRFADDYEAWRAGGNPQSGSGKNPKIAGSGWDPAWDSSLPSTRTGLLSNVQCDKSGFYQTWTDSPVGNDDKAINCVGWYEATAFCIWDSGRLPTEAEWEYAAAGGDEERVYPWGGARPDCSYATFFYGGSPCVPTGVTPVGSVPNGSAKWGHQDLAGNLWEWVLDWYGAYDTNNCADCANFSPGVARSRGVRGGYLMQDTATFLRAVTREYGGPDIHDVSVGVRCARDP
jgi:formylglycine-generating enzyme required for sulfatase activity